MVNPRDTKIISFDVEGTLVTPEFSYAVWFEAIPQRYATKNSLDIKQAREAVEREYHEVGDQRLEWYDISYWFNKMGLGSPTEVMRQCEARVSYYPEVKEVLNSLSEKYRLVVSSGSSGDFLLHLLKDIRPYFWRVHSSITDYRQLKTTEFYTQICREMEVEPERVVHVGDNWQFDVACPSEIGIKALHLDREQKTGNPRSLASLLELKNYLEA